MSGPRARLRGGPHPLRWEERRTFRWFTSLPEPAARAGKGSRFSRGNRSGKGVPRAGGGPSLAGPGPEGITVSRRDPFRTRRRRDRQPRTAAVGVPVIRRPLAVAGCGNAGHALAADLSLAGHEVRLLDHPAAPPAAHGPAGGRQIVLERHGRESVATLAAKTTSPAEALEGAEILLVAVPAFAHRTFAEFVAPHLPAGGLVVLFTGGLGGLEWVGAAARLGRDRDFTVVETSSLPYAARLGGPGRVRILSDVPRLVASAYPASDREGARERLEPLFPCLRFGRDLLEPTLCNVNGVVHPPAVALNVSRIEDETTPRWHIWKTGITPGVARVIERIDEERLRTAERLGLVLPTVAELQWEMGYGPRGSIRESLTKSETLAGIEGPRALDHRFLTEDVPYFLGVLMDLARLTGVSCPAMNAVADLAGYVTGIDFRSQARTLRGLGLAAETPEALIAELSGEAPLACVPAHR